MHSYITSVREVKLCVDIQLTSYVYVYTNLITNLPPLHVTHLSFLSSLFTIGLCIPIASFATLLSKCCAYEFKCYQLAIASNQPNNCALNLWHFIGSQALYIICILNDMETLMMALAIRGNSITIEYTFCYTTQLAI